MIAGRVALYGNTQEAAPKELTTYRDVVKRVLPAVVSIEAKGKPRTASAKLPPGQLPPSFNMPGLPDELKKELREHVVKEIGALARPDEIRFTETLPKTRSGKIMRRLLRDIAGGKQTTGDTTTLEDYSVLARLREEDEA